ncbi:nucleoside monophosphate kinase [Micromonospora sp. NPDC004704]
MTPLAIVLLGIPGSGKTSLAAALWKDFGAAHLTASRILRNHLDRNTQVADRWGDYWKRGLNAPDPEVLPVLWHAFESCESSLAVLDGYPRTTAQLNDFLERGGEVGLSVLLQIPTHIALQRATARTDSGRVRQETAELLAERIKAEQAHIASLLGSPAIAEKLVRVYPEHQNIEEIVKDLATTLGLLPETRSPAGRRPISAPLDGKP